MKILIYIALYTSFVSAPRQIFCQLKVGDPMPNFKLNNVTNFDNNTATLDDFKGKWLLLDFWFSGCQACIRSFPKVNNLQREFNDKLTWVMVGLNDQDKDAKAIEVLYEKFRIKQDLQMVSAYDSILYKDWGISTMPHIYVIDPHGILRFITDGRDMTKEKIQNLVEGKNVTFFDKEFKTPDFDASSIPGNENLESDKIIYRSILTQWNGEKQCVYEIDQYVRAPSHNAYKDGFSLTMVPLFWLYNMAYFGQNYLKIPRDSLYGLVFPHPVLEIQDTTLFKFDFGQDIGKGLYNYSIKIPVSLVTKTNVMGFMREDLERAFNLHASIEMREMPVWKLIAKPGSDKKLITKGGKPSNGWDEGSIAAGFSVRNVPIRTFYHTLIYYINSKEDVPFIDETNIQTNIDITIDADLTNLEDIKRELQKYGLDLIKGFRKVKVLVIKE